MRIQRTLRISTAPAGAVGFGGALTLLEFARTIGGGVEFFWDHGVSRTRFALNSVAVFSPCAPVNHFAALAAKRPPGIG